MRRALVFGAGGAVGEATALALRGAGWDVTASLRQAAPAAEARLAQAGARIVFHTLPEASCKADAVGADAIVFTTHISLAEAALSGVVGPKRLVVFSSNNVAADAQAPSYKLMADAERRLRTVFPNIAIVRPTLIYGDPRLQTLTQLMRLARRLPVLPVPGSGRARVQPVFHEDLGRLAAGLCADDAPSGTFAVGGPDVVTMRDLYRVVIRALRVRRLIVPTPRFAMNIAVRAGRLTAEQVARANTDRTAIVVDPLPQAFAPCTSLAEGLAHHVRLLDGAAPGDA